MTPAPSLFVTLHSHLQPGGGGVQWCSREYHQTLVAAGLQPYVVTFEIDRSLRARFLRRFRPRPYTHRIPGGLGLKITAQAQQHGARWCFLNNTDALALAPILHARMPSLHLVFLSHGAEITDVVNNLRLAPETAGREQTTPCWLGRLLQSEIAIRASLTGSVVISEPDLLIEKWLGSPAAVFLPRSIPRDPLLATGLPGRVGCVATLDHGPNLHGLRLFAEALGRHSGVRLRLVGGPVDYGRCLASQHPIIDYLGPLDDAQLRAEAATWRAFVNPVFCPARGASTKVSTALGWGLPVLTTPDGARGYTWPSGTLPLSESPTALAALACELAEATNPAPSRAAAERLVHAAPTPAQTAAALTTFLEQIRH